MHLAPKTVDEENHFLVVLSEFLTACIVILLRATSSVLLRVVNDDDCRVSAGHSQRVPSIQVPINTRL